MKKLLKILNFLLSHPIGRKQKLKTLHRFIKWQIISHFFPYPIVFPYINNAKLIVKKSLHSATANMYVGLQEFEEMSFTLHLLNKNDIFFDIGANIGIYTILASKIKSAKTHAFEPLITTAFYLKSNVVLNQIESLVEIHSVALGNKNGSVNFSTGLDSENHILNSANKTSSLVDIKKLDSITEDKPILIKLDVEGYEFHVLQGAEKIIADDNLKAIIVEMNGSTNRYGIDEKEIHSLLLKKGFDIYSYAPFKRELCKECVYKNGNNIYIRDLDFVRKRIKNSEKIVVYNVGI